MWIAARPSPGSFLERNGFDDAELLAVQNMINCTGINTDLQAIRCQSELERDHLATRSARPIFSG